MRFRFLASALAATLLLVPAAVLAQTLTPVYQYDYLADGSTGANPYGNLVQANDGNIYGGTLAGGVSGTSDATGGVVFKITPAGEYSVLYSCNDEGSDCNGIGGLLQAYDGNLYGVSLGGGTYGYGAIFQLTLAGQYTNLHSFSNTADGEYPNGNIIFDGTTIYGTNSGSATTGDFAPDGNIWLFQPDFGVGFSNFSNLYTFTETESTDPEGYNPIGGLTKINGLLYGSSQVGAANGCGAVWNFNMDSHAFTTLHVFTCGTDGAYPQGAPKLYSDNFIYGTTVQNGSAGPDFGTVWKQGLQSGFSALYTFTATKHNPNYTVAFDTGGNVLFTAGKAGTSSVGALYLEPHAGGNVHTLYNYAAGSLEGDTPASQPFFDNAGYLWTEQRTGGTNEDGTIDRWILSSETTAPVHIVATPTTVAPSTASTIAWAANNAFSQDEQYCFGSGNSNSNWAGTQTGTYSGGTLSGSKSVSFTSTGDYVFAITCGGTESALTTLHVRLGSKTFLTLTPASVPEGNTVTFKVSVSGNGTGPTGTVTLSAPGLTIGTVTLGSGGNTLSVPTTGLTPGTYSITAAYSGDLQYSASSVSETLTVTQPSGPVPTATTVTASPNPVGLGNNVTLSATVRKSNGSGVPTGNVTFKTGSMVLATVALNGSGVAALTAPTTGYPKGTYPIVAVYNGDSADTTSTSPALNVSIETATTTALTASPNPVSAGSNVTLTAAISVGTATGSVKFMTGSTLLATVTVSGGKAILTAPTTGYPAGTYPIYAVYSGDSNNAGSTSPAVNLTLK